MKFFLILLKTIKITKLQKIITIIDNLHYMLDISVFTDHPEFFVFVDEMGSDRRDQKRKFAYSLRGRTPSAKRLLFRGEHITAIAAMTQKRLLDFWTVVGGVTADIFDMFVANVLLPHLQPFNGVNPCSIMVMEK